MAAPMRGPWSPRRSVVLGSLCLGIWAPSCEGGGARQSEIVSTLVRADESLIRTRPALMAGKLVKMASGPYDFFRGTVPLYRHDMRSGTAAWPTRFGLTVPLVPSLGDPHPENFGVLRAPDGSLGLEPNDFDAADRAPYLWDVRRFAAGLALATREANAGDAAGRAAAAGQVRAVVRAGVVAYREAIARRGRGESIGRVTTFDSPILADLASRANRDFAARRELSDLTVVEAGARKLRRGAVDPEDPQTVHAELPSYARDALPDMLARYRTTLVAPPPAEAFKVLDAARQFGSGVASWPRVRALVLVRGATDAPDDDLVLEVKELADSGIAGLYPPGVYADDVGQRIVTMSRASWARPDAEPYWGVSSWVGLPCQVRLESEGQKGIRVERMVGARGRPDALVAMATALGLVLARVHTSSDEGVTLAQAIYAKISLDPEAFVEEQADFGEAYAERTVADYGHFVTALGALGPRLGLPEDPADLPRADVRALYGSPPPPSPSPVLP